MTETNGGTLNELSVRFWGVRGSIAAPGPSTVEVGGNTPCVEIECGEDRLILDAGTGLRGLGQRMLSRGERRATLLLSHLHWDHIQGLPFFVPAYIPGHELDLIGAPGLATALDAQMKPPCFPVGLDAMKADLTFRDIVPGQTLSVGSLTVRAAGLNHPGGVLGFRVEHGGRAIVYATDTEHYACPDPHLVDLARDADLLIYDAMYTDEEYDGRVGPTKVGWGHSTWRAGVDVANAAGVGQLVLFHHDPTRSDEGVAKLERDAAAARPGTVAAREGDVVIFEPVGQRRVA